MVTRAVDVVDAAVSAAWMAVKEAGEVGKAAVTWKGGAEVAMVAAVMEVGVVVNMVGHSSSTRTLQRPRPLSQQSMPDPAPRIRRTHSAASASPELTAVPFRYQAREGHQHGGQAKATEVGPQRPGRRTAGRRAWREVGRVEALKEATAAAHRKIASGEEGAAGRRRR